MSQSGSDVESDEVLTEVTVSRDELEMLHLFRSMKRGTAVDFGEIVPSVSPSGRVSEAVIAFDEALVIAHDVAADHLQLGFFRLPVEGAQGIELIPVSSAEEYSRIEAIWDQLIGEDVRLKGVGERVKKGSIRERFLKYVDAQLSSAEAVHRRAREAIASHQEASQKAEEVSRRTRELLSHEKD